MSRCETAKIYRVRLGGTNKYDWIRQILPNLGRRIQPSEKMLEWIAQGEVEMDELEEGGESSREDEVLKEMIGSIVLYGMIWEVKDGWECELYPNNPVELLGQKPFSTVDIKAEDDWEKLGLELAEAIEDKDITLITLAY